MPAEKSPKNPFSKEKVEQILGQAIDSLRVLEAIPKEGISRAKEESVRITTQLLADNLKKLGVASKEDVQLLDDKIEQLASELRGQIVQIKKNLKG